MNAYLVFIVFLSNMGTSREVCGYVDCCLLVCGSVAKPANTDSANMKRVVYEMYTNCEVSLENFQNVK
jgi:hypothetical protein